MFERLLSSLVNFRLIEPGFDGNKVLNDFYSIKPAEVILNKTTKQLTALDKKCVAFLKGDDVFFTQSELEEIDIVPSK